MGAKILYIEDHYLLLDLFASLLRSHGHVVYAYGNAEGAHHHLVSTEAEVAIVDVGLPGRSGDDFAAELARRQPQVAILLIAVPRDVQRLNARIPKAAVLAKPVGLADVLGVIDCVGMGRCGEATVLAGHTGTAAPFLQANAGRTSPRWDGHESV